MIVKVRKAKANPCSKKGIDNHRASSRCECEKSCLGISGLFDENSTGTSDHKKKCPESEFIGCLDIEKYLIEHNLLRYESRERSGLDVLFNGIEKVHFLSADYLDIDNLGEIDKSDAELTIGEALNSYALKIEDQLYFDKDSEHDDESSLYIEESALGYIPANLGYGHSMSHDVFSAAPENLEGVVFNYLFKRGEFNKGSDDLYSLALSIRQRRDLVDDIKEVWPRYTEKRYQKNIKLINQIIQNKAPFWAKRFDLIWERLTPEQAEAIKAEYFYSEEEKPTQKELAAKIGIKLSSYKDRLKWAHKKIIKLFPEYEAVARRNFKKTQNTEKIAPLYQINKNGEKTLIPVRQRK